MNTKPVRTINTSKYILLYLTEPINTVGSKEWLYHGIYNTEEEAIGQMLLMPDTMYEHARIIKTKLPTLTVPNDLETITGEPTSVE